MRRSRLSIRAVLFLVAIFGFGFAALKHPSEWWAGGLLFADVCLFVFAVMAIAYRQGARRTFRVGFALFGWTYLVIGFAPAIQKASRPYLLSTKALERARPKDSKATVRLALVLRYASGRSLAQRNAIATLASPSANSSDPLVLLGGSKAPSLNTYDGRLASTDAGSEEFYRVGHALSALFAALVGGGIARILFVDRDDRGEGGTT
jgi:hypothetical protein